LSQELFGTLNDRQREYITAILGSSRRMTDMVGDILDLATIEAGRMELDIDSVDPHAVLVDAFNLVKEHARRKNIRVDFDCPPDIGWIAADPLRLKQIVFNLLTNAIAFTPKLGHVGIAAARDGDRIEIAVTDSGPGIPADERAHVLQPFGRLTDDAHRGEGPGLGLTIVKRFVELHGGTVEIRSNRARGTTVVCRIPVDAETQSGLASGAGDRAIVSGGAGE